MSGQEFNELKGTLVERGEAFAAKSLRSRARIAELGESFVPDGAVCVQVLYFEALS